MKNRFFLLFGRFFEKFCPYVYFFKRGLWWRVYGTFFLHVWISGSFKFNIRVYLLSVLYPIKVKLVRLDFSAIKDFKKINWRPATKKSFINAMLINCKQLKTKKVVKDENFRYRAVKYFLHGCLRIYKSLCFMVCFLPAKDTKDKVNPS